MYIRSFVTFVKSNAIYFLAVPAKKLRTCGGLFVRVISVGHASRVYTNSRTKKKCLRILLATQDLPSRGLWYTHLVIIFCGSTPLAHLKEVIC